MAQQTLVSLVAWQDVDHTPEAGPAQEAAGSHVGGDQVGGGADGHRLVRNIRRARDFRPSVVFRVETQGHTASKSGRNRTPRRNFVR